MKERIFQTSSSLVPLVLRLSLGLVILPHGYLKITDYAQTVAHLTNNYDLSHLTASLVVMIEFFAPLFLLAGIASRIMAFLIGAIMVGAIPYHWSHGFFMNWFGNQAGEGFEFHVLALGLALAIIWEGGGQFSMDRALIMKKQLAPS